MTFARSALSELPRSGIREIMDLASADPLAIRLEVGEPGFPTPPHVVDAANQAALDGFTRYTPSRGIGDLREAASEKIKRINALDIGADGILVTAGAINGLLVTLAALLASGDGLLIPNPGWPNYRNMAAILGLNVVSYDLPPDGGFQPDPASIEELLASHPSLKAMIVNTPSNPTGSVLGASTIDDILDVCRRNDVFLISDEVYDEIIFDATHVSPASRAESELCVSVYSLSKTYAMTGWRVGYVAASTSLIDDLAKVQETWNSCVNSVAQKAAVAALNGPQDHVKEMVSAYRRRRDTAMGALSAHGLEGWKPEGAFYVMISVPAIDDVTAFAKDLVRSHHVGVAPGTTFGAAADGMLRISLASSVSDIEEGIRRLALGVKTHAAP